MTGFKVAQKLGMTQSLNSQFDFVSPTVKHSLSGCRLMNRLTNVKMKATTGNPIRRSETITSRIPIQKAPPIPLSPDIHLPGGSRLHKQ
jgi:hypothetical protein